MNRRDFLQKTASGTAFVALGGLSLSSFTGNDLKRLTILHTNDTHSHIDPFPSDHGKYPNQGGVAKRKTLIDKIRKESKNVLLLDAGDMFQGTPYFNYFGGELEIKLMNMLQYDATTIGNHEFDNGVGGLASQIVNANFDILNANYDFKNTVMDGLTKPYRVFIKDGIRIGVFGLGVKLAGLVNKREYGETVFINPVEVAQDMSRILKEQEKCDLIICLSHLGYKYDIANDNVSDLMLASQTKNIDLIIGGHTHTFLDKPTIVKNSEDKDVMINQVGCFGLVLGQIDFFFDTSKNSSTLTKNIIV